MPDGVRSASGAGRRTDDLSEEAVGGASTIDQWVRRAWPYQVNRFAGIQRHIDVVLVNGGMRRMAARGNTQFVGTAERLARSCRSNGYYAVRS